MRWSEQGRGSQPTPPRPSRLWQPGAGAGPPAWRPRPQEWLSGDAIVRRPSQIERPPPRLSHPRTRLGGVVLAGWRRLTRAWG